MTILIWILTRIATDPIKLLRYFEYVISNYNLQAYIFLNGKCYVFAAIIAIFKLEGKDSIAMMIDEYDEYVLTT